MGIISGIWEKRDKSINAKQWLFDAFLGRPTASGAKVNEETAMRNTAVFACVRVIAETIASLPLIVYKRLDGGGKERAIDHPLYRILHDQANDYMTAYTFRETLSNHLLRWGNAYAEIQYQGDGSIRALWPLPPNLVTPEKVNGTQVQYRVSLPDGGQAILRSEQVLHIPGLSFDGLIGYSPIQVAREAIGLSLAAEEFGARFFGNGAQLGGVLEHPEKLSDEAFKHLRESLEQKYSGLSNSHRLMILEEGMKYTRIGIPPEDAQFLETRKFQVNEIARLYRVPPHMIGDLERATFSNIEHQSIEFVVHTVRPWLVRWEQAILMKLFKPSEKRRFFAEFLVDGLLRGDTKSRYEAYAIGRQNGWLSADDIRELENMNPLPDGQGKTYLIPMNMVPADQFRQHQNDLAIRKEDRGLRKAWEKRALESAQKRHQVAQAHKRLFQDAMARVVRREVNDIQKAAKKYLTRRNLTDFNSWLIEFYEEHPDFMEKNMLPVFMAYAELVHGAAAEEIGTETGLTPAMEEFVRAYVANFIMRYVGESTRQIQSIVRESMGAGADVLEAIEQRLAEWEEKRPGKVASWEVIQAGNAIALATYTAGGVLNKRWNAIGEDCPYCRPLDGKVVGLNQPFIERDRDYQPEGAETSLRPHYNIGHPPLHRGCDCMVTSAL